MASMAPQGHSESPGSPSSQGTQGPFYTLKEMQSFLDGQLTNVMTSLSLELSNLASSFEKDVRAAMRKHQSNLTKRKGSSMSSESLSTDLRGTRGPQGTALGPVVPSPTKPETDFTQDWGPHGNEGKTDPSAGEETVFALPTVLEDIEVNPDPFPFMHDSFEKMKSMASRDSLRDSGSNLFTSSEAATPFQISPMSSGLIENGPNGEQVGDRTSNNTTNLAKVLAAGRKSARQISPPEETTVELNGRLETIVGTFAEHSWLDCIMGFMVLLNSLTMAMELECIGNESAAAVDVHVTWDCAHSSVFPILEHVFTWIFATELALRAWATRCKYFRNLFNLGDTFLVILPMIDLYVLAPLADWSANVDILRLLRLGKLARAVRLMRTLRLFRGLRLLVQACSSFLPSLAWSMALLGICMMMGSLVMGNLLQEYITDSEEPMEARVWVWTYYGTAYRAMYTMYEITLAGNWPTRARPILEYVDHRFAIFYVIYVTFIVFAVIRIITAVFLRETLEAANNDAEMMVQERLLQNARYVKKLEGIFAAMDESGDGLLTEDEMTQLLLNPRVQAYLQSMDLDVAEGQALFQLLQNGEGMVTYEDFIDGVLRCKGPARAIDQICLQCDVKNVADSLKSLVSSLEENKVIRGKRRQGRRRRVHKEDLLLLASSRPNKGMSRQTSPQ